MRFIFKTKATKSKAKVKQNARAEFNWYALRKFSLVVMSITLVSWGYFKVTDTNTFPINSVKIVGEYGRVEQFALKDAIGPYVTDGFFRVNVKGIQQNVETLPWVAKAVVRRHWPDTVEVAIAQQQAQASWNQAAVIDDKQQLFPANNDMSPVGLPSLHGPEGAHLQVWRDYQQMQAQLEPLGLQIVDLRMDKRRAWRVELDNGMQLLLGKVDYMHQLRHFSRSYTQVFAAREARVGTVDLRYRNAMAVRWKLNDHLV